MQQRFSVVVEDIAMLDFLPSGSGLAIMGDSAYIVGDDATAVYCLNLAQKSYRRIPLNHLDQSVRRLPKPIKPDYESAAIGDYDGRPHLFAFGSGLVSPHRDSMLLMDLANEYQQNVSLKSVYDAICKKHNIAQEELNIEGAVITKQHLVLISRGQNLLFRFHMRDISNYIKDGTMPRFTSIPVDLQDTARIKSGLSGACAIRGNKLLFCATREDAPNWILDGPILGSSLGIMHIAGKRARVTAHALLKDKSGKTLIEKVESIDIAGKYPNGDLKVIGIADNDDGTSKLLVLRVRVR